MLCALSGREQHIKEMGLRRSREGWLRGKDLQENISPVQVSPMERSSAGKARQPADVGWRYNQSFVKVSLLTSAHICLPACFHWEPYPLDSMQQGGFCSLAKATSNCRHVQGLLCTGGGGCLKTHKYTAYMQCDYWCSWPGECLSFLCNLYIS